MKTKILSVYILILAISLLASFGFAVFSLDMIDIFIQTPTDTQIKQYVVFSLLTGGYITFKTLDYLFIKVIKKHTSINYAN